MCVYVALSVCVRGKGGEGAALCLSVREGNIHYIATKLVRCLCHSVTEALATRNAKDKATEKPAYGTASSASHHGELGRYGTIEPFLEDNNKCDATRKEKIDKLMIRMVLRAGLSLGFLENIQFQDLVRELCPAYAKCRNSFPSKILY